MQKPGFFNYKKVKEPLLQDYLKLAALQYELDREEAENEAVPNEGDSF